MNFAPSFFKQSLTSCTCSSVKAGRVRIRQGGIVVTIIVIVVIVIIIIFDLFVGPLAN